MTFTHFDDLPLVKQVERWENVERVLSALSPHERRKHWNMNYWGQKTECGSICCAAGHCGLDTWFRRRGFKTNFNSIGEVIGAEERYFSINPEFSIKVANFFGEDGSENIFYNETLRPVSKVIKEVRAHIKQLKAAA